MIRDLAPCFKLLTAVAGVLTYTVFVWRYTQPSDGYIFAMAVCMYVSAVWGVFPTAHAHITGPLKAIILFCLFMSANALIVNAIGLWDVVQGDLALCVSVAVIQFCMAHLMYDFKTP